MENKLFPSKSLQIRIKLRGAGFQILENQAKTGVLPVIFTLSFSRKADFFTQKHPLDEIAKSR